MKNWRMGMSLGLSLLAPMVGIIGQMAMRGTITTNLSQITFIARKAKTFRQTLDTELISSQDPSISLIGKANSRGLL